nr:hypothetical protein [Corynebacterium lactis]
MMPDDLPDDHWMQPLMVDETFDTKLVRQFLLLTNQTATPLAVNLFLRELAEELSDGFLPRIDRELQEKFGKTETDDQIRRARRRLLFQFRQHQFATKLMTPALEANEGRWSSLHPLMTAHRPFRTPSTRVDAVMRVTVRKAHEELGLPTDPESIDKRWEALNNQVDLLVTQRQIQLYQQWMSQKAPYPTSERDMEKLWEREQMQAANQVIYEELTEPIIAKSLDEEENISRAEDLL